MDLKNNIRSVNISSSYVNCSRQVLHAGLPDESKGDTFETKSVSELPKINRSINGNLQPKRYLNIFWNQHQPFYKDEAKDEFLQPWVRLHAAKDYYGMAAILADYPNVHATINLSSSLLLQLVQYITKLRDFADVTSSHRGDLNYYPSGHVDRWHDLMVKDVTDWTPEDKLFASDNFFLTDYKAQIQPFDGYRYLYDKRKKGEPFTKQDYRDLKVWYHLAWTDSIFLKGAVSLLGEGVDGKPMEPQEIVKTPAGLIKKGAAGGYGNANFTEEDAKSLAFDQYAILKYVIPVHRMLQNRKAPDGHPQLEVVTTPFYHPVLPLIHDTQLASECNPGMPLPNPPFQAPDDAVTQVVKGRELYTKLFGQPPRGMWPGEGAVAEAVVPAFQKGGIKWIATGQEVLAKSGHAYDNGMIYRIDCDKEFLDHDGPNGTTDNSDAMSIVFRSAHDKIGFNYGALKGGLDGIDAARDFLNDVRSWQHWRGTPQDKDILYTTTADGENCWGNYINNGHDFLESLYGLLNNQGTASGVLTTTPAAYMEKHPIDEQYELEPLAVGGWVGGEFSTWIGEPSENDAWGRLRTTREALVASGVPRPNPVLTPPSPLEDRQGYFAWKAWEALYAAEGSDWFWWFGDDQRNNPGWQPRYADDFRMHLINAVTFAKQGGFNTPYFPELIKPLDASDVIMPLPPVTANPKGIVADGIGKDRSAPMARYAKFSIQAAIDPLCKCKIKDVKIDLASLGFKDKQLLIPCESPNINGNLSFKQYTLTVQLPKDIGAGKYILPLVAESTGGAVTRDFIALDVIENGLTTTLSPKGFDKAIPECNVIREFQCNINMMERSVKK